MSLVAWLSPRRLSLAAGVCAVAFGSAALADDEEVPKDFEAYLSANMNTCVGPADGKQVAPTVYDLNGFHYEINGPRAKVTRTSTRKGPGVRLGVVNAIKDSEPKTIANVSEYLAKFKEADVDGVVVG